MFCVFFCIGGVYNAKSHREMFVLCGLWEMMFVLTIILSAPIPLVIIVSSLQDQLLALQSQLDHANAQLSDNNRQIELLTEQIRIMNQRFFGRYE